jgi:hypothetical protein
MLLAILSLLFIGFTEVPVLEGAEGVHLLSDYLWSLVFVVLTVLVIAFSIFRYSNRKQQLMLNQVAKLTLSASFFVVFFQKGDNVPTDGLFYFVAPYLLIVLANYFIKKDEKLVQSADRLR